MTVRLRTTPEGPRGSRRPGWLTRFGRLDRQPWVYPGLVVFAGLLFFAPALISRRLTLPLDILGYWYPWNVESDVFDGSLPQNPLIQDLLTLTTAWYDFAWHEVRAGRFPLWNPWQVGGMPFLANDESAVLYPLQWVAWLLPLSVGLQFMLVAETLGLGLGMYAFLRAIGLGRPAACLGGSGTMLGGFSVVWLGYPQAAVAMWLPWSLLCCERLLQGRPWRRWTAALGLATGLHLLAGHVETSAHVLMACAIYSAGRALGQCLASEGRLPRGVALRRVGAIAGGLLLGVGLAAAQLGPTLQYLQASYTQFYRQSAPAETPQPLSNLASWLVPNISGNPAFNAVLPVQQSLNGAYFNFNERTAYVGVAMLVLAAMAPGHRRRRLRQHNLVFVLLLVVAGGIAYGIPPIYSLAVRLPVLHDINHNRLLFVVAFALVALGATGFDSLAHLAGSPPSAPSLSSKLVGYASVVGAGVLVAVAVLLSKQQIVDVVASVGGDPGAPTIVDWLRAWTAWALVLLLLSVALIAATRTGRVDLTSGRLAVSLVLLADLLVVGERYASETRAVELFPDVLLTQVLRGLGPNARFIAGQPDWREAPATFTPNMSTGYQLRDMNVYDAVIAYRSHAFMDAVNRNGPNYNQPTLLVANYAPDYRLLALAGVTHVLLPTADAEPTGADGHLIFQRESGPLDRPLEPLLPGVVETQSFVAPADDLNAVGVYAAGDPRVDGALVLDLTSPESGQVAHAHVDLAGRSGPGWLVMSFPPISASAGRTFTASLTLEPGVVQSEVRLVGDPAARLEHAERQLSGQTAPGVLRFRLFRSTTSTTSASVHAVWNDASHTLYALDEARPRAYVPDSLVLAADQAAALADLDRLTVPGNDAVIEAPGPVASAGGTASILWDHPGDIGIQVSADAPAVLVLEESYADGGWNVDIDGASGAVLRANYLFQATIVPAGTHIAHFRYWPVSLSVGIGVSLAALVTVLLLAFGARLPRRGVSPTPIVWQNGGQAS